MRNQHLIHILNHFPPLKRRSLLHWVQHSSVGSKYCHKSFLACMKGIPAVSRQKVLDRKTKIAFSLLHEFGNRFSSQRVTMTLVDAIEMRLGEKEQVGI